MTGLLNKLRVSGKPTPTGLPLLPRETEAQRLADEQKLAAAYKSWNQTAGKIAAGAITAAQFKTATNWNIGDVFKVVTMPDDQNLVVKEKDELTDGELARLADASVVDLDVWENDDRVEHGRIVLRQMWEQGLDARPLLEPPDEKPPDAPVAIEAYGKTETLVEQPGMTGYHVLTPIQIEFVANDPVAASKALAESLRRHAARLDKSPPAEWLKEPHEKP